MITCLFRMYFVLVVCLVNFVSAIPIDNGVQGDPEIECAATSITINVNTQNIFDGTIYVRGFADDPQCINGETGRRVAGLTVELGQCELSRRRSLNPKGVFITTSLVVSFHKKFVTKVDRSYFIQCFYMEADKTVDDQILVSALTTVLPDESVLTGAGTIAVPMPVCRYEILSGGPSGPVIEYAAVGQMVYHKWTCDTETVDTFCMTVHTCYVDDTSGDRVDLVDANGCALDRYLLQNLEYPMDLMAGQEAHVFKFKDKPALFFQCQLSVVVKDPGEECSRPVCPALSRKKRESESDDWDFNDNVIDVSSQIIKPLDIEDKINSLPEQYQRNRSPLTNQFDSENSMFEHRTEFCFSSAGVTLAVSLIVAVAFLCTVISTMFLLRHMTKQTSRCLF